LGERSLATLGELAPFALVLIRQDQAAVSQPAQNRRLRHDVPVVADHRPDLAVPPERMLPGVLVDQLGRSIAGRLRPRTLRPSASPSLGLPPPPGPLRDVELSAPPRGRHPRLDTNHLEVLEGPNRPSALFF